MEREGTRWKGNPTIETNGTNVSSSVHGGDGSWDRADRWILLLLVLAGLLLVLPGLGRNHLWTDEAHTAVLGRNILQNGLPLASDGRNLLTFFGDHRDIRNGVYIWQPWLPAYLAAASMAVFGADTLGARLPFALSFVVLIAVSYRSFRRWHPERHAALLGIVAMLGCVPMLTHARQCRYYMLAPLFCLLAVNAYQRLHTKPGLALTASLTLWFTLLFNAFYPAAFVLGLALTVDVLVHRPNKRTMLAFVYAGAAFLAINAPVAIYCKIWDRHFGVQPGYSDIKVFGLFLLRYLLTINTYFFPLVLVAAAAVWRWRELVNRNWLGGDRVRLLLIVCAVTVISFALLADFPFTRYLIGITPFLFFLGGSTIWTVTGRRPRAAWLLLLAVMTTNVLHVLPLPLLTLTKFQQAKWTVAGIESTFIKTGEGSASFARGEIKTIINTRLSSPLFGYLKSIRRPPKGPMDWIVEYLDENASPDDRVVISYGDVCLMFHTDLVATTGLEGRAPPEWIIARRYNPFGFSQELLRVLTQYKYVTVLLPVPDVQWNNRPDPVYHYFTPPPLAMAPAVRIWRRAD